MSTIQRDACRAVFHPATNIVACEIESIRSEMKLLIEDGVNELVIDMSDVQMLDSMGLGVLISAFNTLKKRGGSFSVINASKDIYDLFRNMRLTQHFSVTTI